MWHRCVIIIVTTYLNFWKFVTILQNSTFNMRSHRCLDYKQLPLSLPVAGRTRMEWEVFFWHFYTTKSMGVIFQTLIFSAVFYPLSHILPSKMSVIPTFCIVDWIQFQLDRLVLVNSMKRFIACHNEQLAIMMWYVSLNYHDAKNI